MVKETKPLTERPSWLPDDGPRYIVSMETQESCPGTKHYKGILQTENLDEALKECAAAAKEEGKESIVRDRWEFQVIHKETPAVSIEKKSKTTRKFLEVVSPVHYEAGEGDDAEYSGPVKEDEDDGRASKKPKRRTKSK